LTSGEVIEAGTVVPRDEGKGPERVALSEVFPFSLPALERCASVQVKPLFDPYGEQVYGAIVLGVEHQALLAEPYINPINLIIDEAAVKLSWLHAHEQLRQLAMFDGLTSLSNHRSFQSELDQILKRARRAERPTALILLDIDHFKNINDSYGHPFGDQVLKGVAGALKESMREVDLVARYGGEEFGVALEDSSIEDVKIAAERARSAVEALSFSHKGEEVKVTISLGVALFPNDASEKTELIDRADQSLYEAKRRGRNQVRIWSESRLDERSPSRMWTRHPVAGSQELRGLDALISPSGDELEVDGIFETSQQRLLEERALRADGRAPSSDDSRDP
jgi:diguanylate cyclase (GGDEF)-like protein